MCVDALSRNYISCRNYACPYSWWKTDVTNASYLAWTKDRRSGCCLGNATARLTGHGESIAYARCATTPLTDKARSMHCYSLLHQYLRNYNTYDTGLVQTTDDICHICVCVNLTVMIAGQKVSVFRKKCASIEGERYHIVVGISASAKFTPENTRSCDFKWSLRVL